MNNPQKIATTITVVGVASAAVVLKMNEYYKDIYNRFPELDRKVARKAFRRFLWRTFNQQTDVEDHLTDEEMDVLFLKEVQYILNRK